MAGKRDIQITKGDDYAHVVTITNSSGAINITGRTYIAQIRTIKTQTLPDASFTIVLTNPTAGELTLYLSHTITTALSAGDCRYFWDLQETASGVITTILAGRLTVDQDVSR